ncbi:hypothetical protein ACQR1Q_07920 [Bradyrhizobium oligotrophicum]
MRAYCLSDDERKAIGRGLQEMRERKFADEAAVSAVFDRYRAATPLPPHK